MIVDVSLSILMYLHWQKSRFRARLKYISFLSSKEEDENLGPKIPKKD